MNEWINEWMNPCVNPSHIRIPTCFLFLRVFHPLKFHFTPPTGWSWLHRGALCESYPKRKLRVTDQKHKEAFPAKHHEARFGQLLMSPVPSTIPLYNVVVKQILEQDICSKWHCVAEVQYIKDNRWQSVSMVLLIQAIEGNLCEAWCCQAILEASRTLADGQGDHFSYICEVLFREPLEVVKTII
jgi:hypothetical protein